MEDSRLPGDALLLLLLRPSDRSWKIRGKAISPVTSLGTRIILAGPVARMLEIRSTYKILFGNHTTGGETASNI